MHIADYVSQIAVLAGRHIRTLTNDFRQYQFRSHPLRAGRFSKTMFENLISDDLGALTALVYDATNRLSRDSQILK